MLKSYEAEYDHGRLNWLTDAPTTQNRLRVIVTIVQEFPETSEPVNTPPKQLLGKMRILCDSEILMEPVVEEEAWDALK